MVRLFNRVLDERRPVYLETFMKFKTKYVQRKTKNYCNTPNSRELRKSSFKARISMSNGDCVTIYMRCAVMHVAVFGTSPSHVM
jgi:hypothetical protein